MLDLFYPQTIEVIKSKINGSVRVTKYRGNYSVWVAGFEQSGPIYVEKLWKKGLAKISFTPKNVLILGLGCGTLVKLIDEKWPKAKITGVEIDPVMLGLGEKYFGLATYPNLKILLADAPQLVNQLKSKRQKFDLVLVDLYRGGQSRVLSGDFLNKAFAVLAGGGRVVCNQLILPGGPHLDLEDLVASGFRGVRIIEKLRSGDNLLVYLAGDYLHGSRTRTRRNRS